MARSAKSSPALQKVNDSNLTNDYHDENNGILYNLMPSRNFDSFTVTFFDQQTFDEITVLLNAEYTFKSNSNGSATITATEVDAQKVVLTLYKTKKLLAQGSGSWEWRNTVFRNLSSKLTPHISDASQVSPGHTPNRHRSDSAQVENKTSNSSPISKMVNTLINRVMSPRAASSPINSETGDTPQRQRKK